MLLRNRLRRLNRGPNLGTTYVVDDDVETLGDLKRLYPLPRGYRYEVADWGQPVVRRVEDDAVFSFLLEEGMLTFDYRREKPGGGIAYDTSEVFHIDDATDCPRKEWEVEGGGCVSGFASED